MSWRSIECGGWAVVTGGASGVGLAPADRAFYLIERGNQLIKEPIIVNVPVL
ncbi:MAG: short-subunit dehydrogenase involved in D-alanine esterification of teichoic acids [Candidatus Azotimanducaceae bacterium]|jgi:short-subunit dehydrogenase involved in D-alanine esterification of teichoic acids